MIEWCNRPLDSVYPVIVIDAVHLKVRDGQVTNQAFYVAVGVTCDGTATSSGSGPATAPRAASTGLRC